MTPQNLLLSIAQTGYDIGYAAKKNLATFDITEKLPGWIGIISLAVGIFALFVDELATNYVSATFILIGIATTSLNAYLPTKETYAENGTKLTKLFHELRFTYYEVKSLHGVVDLIPYLVKLQRIQDEALLIKSTKQVFLSDWYAHYKFFWQMQIDWVNEQKNFKLIRDKLPLSFSLTVLVLILFLVGFITVKVNGCLF